MPFSEITKRSLQHTLTENRLSFSSQDIDHFMEGYDNLNTFPDVQPALESLSKASGVTAVVFSNGTKSMVTNSVTKSADLSPHASLFQDIIVVEETSRFKPDPEVYKMLARKVGKESRMGDMWLISGNPFDVVGAKSAGMQAAWVDRPGAGWTDALIEGEAGRPTAIVRGLGEVAEIVKKHAGY